ncbi:MAG: Holliday junction resolvase RuvX [Candidatus Peribacteraceae bacterium]
MRFLALDIGSRRTGVAFLDDAIGIPLPLDTVTSSTPEEFVVQVMGLIAQRNIDHVYVGLPRLPSGEEGSQAAFVRDYAALLSRKGVSLTFIDERHTTPRKARTQKERQIPERKTDSDSAAACEILKIAVKC